MTHEELLAKLNNLFGNDFYDNADRNTIALRAVVELHKPNEFNDCCNGCDGDLPCSTIQAIEEVFRFIGKGHQGIPAPTIQAIEKELK